MEEESHAARESEEDSPTETTEVESLEQGSGSKQFKKASH